LSQYPSFHHAHNLLAQLWDVRLAEGLHVLRPQGRGSEKGEGKGLVEQIQVHVYILDANRAERQR
jgi:hypothetical protein